MLIAAAVVLAGLSFAAGFFCRAVSRGGKVPARVEPPVFPRAESSGESELRGLLEAIEKYDGTQSRG